MTHRQPLLALLASYAALDDRDQAQAARFQSFVEGQAHCFHRDCWDGHITGSAWVVDPTGRQVLLTHHRKLNLWLQLGGHADGDADVLRVAWREAREESGIDDISLVLPGIFDLDIHVIPARPGEPSHRHFDARFAFRAGSTAFRVGPESHDLAWVDINRLRERTTDPSLLRMAEKWRRHLGS